MRITRIIAGLLLIVSGSAQGLNAQSLRSAEPPAEFPPASFKGSQYVDSRGCVYIRAGINGNVTWVPRVTQQRTQICGYRPSLTPEQLAQAPKPRAGTGDQPEILTLDPQDRPRRSEAETSSEPRRAEVRQPAAPSPGPAPTVYTNPPPPAAAAPAPRQTKTAEAQKAQRTPSPGPAPTVYTNPPPKQAAAAPQATATAEAPKKRYVPSPAPEPTVYTNPAPKTAAAPQTAPRKVQTARPSPAPAPTVVATAPNAAARPATTAELAPETRVIRRHIYDNRQNTQNVTVPPGYRTVWSDGRLNPNRAEHTLAPGLARRNPPAPPGYAPAWEDDRLNTRRALTTAAGNAQTDGIWTRTLPRELVQKQSRGKAADLPGGKRRNSPFWEPPVEQAPATTRLSTRSAPQGKPHYVRVALYKAEDDARTTARAFAQRGLPMRLGRAQHSGASYSAVLAGPFGTEELARQALAKVQNAGFGGAKIIR